MVNEVRVDSVGFHPGEHKHAYLMTSHAVSGEHFAIVDSHGETVLSGDVPSVSRGRWSASYPDVYSMSFSGLRRLGH